MHEEAVFFQELFFKDFSLSFLNLNCAKLIFSDESRFSSVLNFNAGHLGDKKSYSELQIWMRGERNHEIEICNLHRFNSGNVGIRRSTLSFLRIILIKIQV